MTLTIVKKYSLAPHQENLWRSHFLSSKQNHLNMFTSWLLPATANINSIKLSFQQIHNKYSLLKTTYHIEDGKPMMLFHENQPLDFQEINLSHLGLEEFNSYLCKEAHTPFNLEESILKVRVFENCLNQRILLINIHHIAIDGISMMVIMKELGSLYDLYSKGEFPDFPVLDDKYFEFAAKERELSLENKESRHYWKKRLKEGNGIHPVNLSSKDIKPHSFEGETIYFSVDKELTHTLKQTSKQLDTNLYNILLAAFQILLHKYSQQKHIWVGTPFFNRTRKTIKSVGFYANTIFIDGMFTNELSIRDLVKQLSEKFESSKKHLNISYSSLLKIMQENRAAETHGGPNIMFNFPNLSSLTKNNLGSAFLGVPGEKGKFGTLEFEVYPLKRMFTQFEIEFDGIESKEGISFRLQFDPTKYDLDLMKRFSAHFVQILKGITSSADSSVDELPLLKESEMEYQINNLNPKLLFNSTDKPNLISVIEEQARLNPNAVAVTDGERNLTFRELSETSSRISGSLIDRGIHPEEKIGLAIKNSIEAVSGILGILKAGAVYVPLDPNYPKERIEYMLDDACITSIITDGSLGLSLPETNYIFFKDLVNGQTQISDINPKQLAYIIYTSGSTGRPKGVMVTHENIYYSTLSRNNVYSLKESCRFLLLSSISFDSSMVGIFWTLSIGGSVVLTDMKNQLDVQHLLGLIEKEKVTHLLSVPSFIQMLLSQATQEQLSSLECAIVAGEPFPKSLHAYQKEKFPNLFLFNEYGPTEGTVWSSYYQVDENFNHSSVPIGYPSPHANIFILDKHLNLIPQGTEGEIYISGQGVTRGYNNHPIQTAEKFIPSPYGNGERLYKTGDLASYNEDGSIHFHGRVDGQVKINGFRIEVGEIEATIEEEQDVKKAVVLLKKEKNLPARLFAFIAAPNDFSVNELKRKLISRLPHYMVPSSYIVLPELPLTPNGKINTKHLLELKLDSNKKKHHIIHPVTAEEKMLCKVLAEILQEEVSLNDSFFEIGGDSILAIQLSSKLMEKGWVLKPKDIFDKKTILNIAKAMKVKEKGKIIKVADGNEFQLTPIQKWFFSQNFLYQNHWNQAVRLRIRKDIPYVWLEEAITYLLKVHPSLRLRFFQKNGSWMQKIEESNGFSFKLIRREVNYPSNSEKEISRFSNELQASLNIQDGLLFTAAYFDCEAESENELIIIAHHLIVDMVSWQIILQDLDHLIGQKISGEKFFLQDEEFNYSDWFHHLIEQNVEPYDQEKEHYVTALDSMNKGSEGSKKSAVAKLEKESTSTLLKDVPKYFETKPNEVILAAICLSLKGIKGIRDIKIDLEGHGREPFSSDIDLSRTVGWFTNVCPILLESEYIVNPDNHLLKHIKNRLRGVPNGGITHAIARWLNQNEETHRHNSPFSYNYLGKIDQAFFRAKHFSFHSYLSDSVRNPEEKRSYLLEFEPYILNEQLYMKIIYGPSFSENGMTSMCEDILENIRKLIMFCTETEEIGMVASDFPNANLDQGALDRFLLSLKQSN
ncbi:amino acid adenylation domain-containing protein [Bacillus infantis]|uniref:amino acid adenylation domain-containing protein n=1 Tax=Bacillus infantis TaxID=324767 RepID=UPI003CF3D0C7